MSRFEGQQSECDQTANTQEFKELMGTQKEFIVPGFWLAILLGYAPQFTGIITSVLISTESIASSPKGAGPTGRRFRPLSQLSSLRHYRGRRHEVRV